MNYHKVIQFVCDLAQMEFGTACDVTDIKNYYVLVLLMAGVIDDLEQSLNEILRARDIPISVVIVKIGNAEETDQQVLLSKANQVFTACERTFIDLLDFEKFKVPMSTCIEEDLFSFELLKNLPAQVEKFMELQRFDMDVSDRMCDSPTHTELSLSS